MPIEKNSIAVDTLFRDHAAVSSRRLPFAPPKPRGSMRKNSAA
jgi:hypothetical protein